MYSKPTMLTSLGIDLQLSTNPEKLYVGQPICASMAVGEKTITPYGVLSGGASLALAESLAGYGSTLLCEQDEIPNGMQVSANHIASAKNGECVIAKGTLLHKGKRTHIWNIDIIDSNNKLISSVRVTNMIIKRR